MPESCIMRGNETNGGPKIKNEWNGKGVPVIA